jgi:hypothetical protein
MGLWARLKAWAKGPLPEMIRKYDGKARAECERCQMDVMLRVDREGEILNVRMIGGQYVCQACGEALLLWDEGESVWVGKNESGESR